MILFSSKKFTLCVTVLQLGVVMLISVMNLMGVCSKSCVNMYKGVWVGKHMYRWIMGCVW